MKTAVNVIKSVTGSPNELFECILQLFQQDVVLRQHVMLKRWGKEGGRTESCSGITHMIQDKAAQNKEQGK
jgi:hypothetical protein